MKQFILPIAIILAISDASAATYCSMEVSSPPSGYSLVPMDVAENCASTRTLYMCDPSKFLCDFVTTCSSCSGSYPNAYYTYMDGTICTDIPITQCCKTRPGPWSGNWTAWRPGYQRMENRDYECDGTYIVTYSYRCAAGYYGSSTNGSSGCSKCPSPGTSDAGATSITSCYIKSGTTGTETNGTYIYTSNCYYSN